MLDSKEECTINELIRNAYDKMRQTAPDEALSLLNEALCIDYDHKEALYALNCLNWWLDKIKDLSGFNSAYEKGGFLLSRWKGYYSFLNRIGQDFDSCQYAVRHFIYALALRYYKEVLEDGTCRFDPVLLLQIGRCYKGVGDYEKALEYLMICADVRKEDGHALSELADVYALIGKTRSAKALFREAFYVDPEGVDLQSLESELILKLIECVVELGYKGDVLIEYLPVYGTMLGVFSIKRGLKPAEVGKLRQAIFSLESEVRTNPKAKEKLVPRLVNKYLWLIAHFENENASSSEIESIKLKIKIIDPSVYNRFMS
ncbi:hypothetical protein AGMMS50212_04900 [Spirochaetia bacterium]|nr:hypothetical protein AGMMS50212_04900 [Spirochaetia bacterium]